eukprot:12412320-Karenia_brevis.AAC.1
MVLYVLAGQEFQGNLQEFRDMGVQIDYTGDVKFMQVPVVGSAAFVGEWAAQKMGIIKRVLN